MKTVKEIAKLTGVSIRTLRYYDEIGLLVPAGRTEAGYRLYDEKALEKLNAILFLRELEIPLAIIKEAVNSEDGDYASLLKGYRKELVRKIHKFQGLLAVLDGMDSKQGALNFKAFSEADAKIVAEAMGNIDEETQVLLKQNVTDGKVGTELLQIYGSKEAYLSAVEESALHPEVIVSLQEELKEIYFAFRDFKGEPEQTHELVKRLEQNTKAMYRTSNARYMLLKDAEEYLSKGRIAQVLDELYGEGVTDAIGKAILLYYGESSSF